MLSITALNAREGDALWIRWGDDADPHQLIIDMGTEGVGKGVATRLLALPEAKRVLDLLVITHVDADHIGGVLTCLADDDAPDIPGLVIEDVWFNGWPHLNGQKVQIPGDPPGLEPMGAAQGERLASWLKGRHWNAAFGGGAVVRTPGTPPPVVTLHDGLTLTVLGPTQARFDQLKPTWKAEVELALEKGTLTEVSHGLEPMGPKVPPDLESKVDLEVLAATATDGDPSKANGASIVLLLDYQGKRVLLTGDGFGDDVRDGVLAISPNQRLKLDAFKAPHHGSQNNVTASMVATVDCPVWILSSDGNRFRHPDPVALARILTGSTQPVEFLFNAPSTFNGWWSNPDWIDLFGYTATYGTKQDGITLTLL